MSTVYDQIILKLKDAQEDVVKGYSGVAGSKAASARARSTFQEVKNLLGEARKEILACSKGETPPKEVENKI